jgi:folate-binding Fe-S cluster repair protein YgfZ
MELMNIPSTEWRAAHQGALVQARPDRGVLIVTGRERQSWLNGLVTCDLTGKKPGLGAYGLVVGKTGRIAAEVWVILGEDHLAVALPADRLEMLREHFDRHLIMEDAEVHTAPERGVIAVHGPLAGELVVTARELGADAALVDFTGRGETLTRGTPCATRSSRARASGARSRRRRAGSTCGSRGACPSSGSTMMTSPCRRRRRWSRSRCPSPRAATSARRRCSCSRSAGTRSGG